MYAWHDATTLKQNDPTPHHWSRTNRFALQHDCGQGAGSNGRPATKGLELGACDTALVIHLNLNQQNNNKKHKWLQSTRALVCVCVCVCAWV